MRSCSHLRFDLNDLVGHITNLRASSDHSPKALILREEACDVCIGVCMYVRCNQRKMNLHLHADCMHACICLSIYLSIYLLSITEVEHPEVHIHTPNTGPTGASWPSCTHTSDAYSDPPVQPFDVACT